MSEEIRALNAKLPKPDLAVGDIIQTRLYQNTSQQALHGFTKPCEIRAIYPSLKLCQSGWVMDLRWPDGFTCNSVDTGWAYKPKHIKAGTKPGTIGETIIADADHPPQFELFQ